MRDHRRAGVLGDLLNYSDVASCLPTNLRLFYLPVDIQPPGYNVAEYGVWPGPCWLLKVRYAPTWNSFLQDTNWHTVTMIATRGPTLNNILRLGPLLSRIFALLCDCRSGVKTNSICSHCGAMVKSVMAPALFRSTKVRESRMTDVYR